MCDQDSKEVLNWRFVMSATDARIEEAGRLLERTRSLLVITGAGISAESGVPTYRGPQGIWNQRPELAHILSADGLARDPQAVWAYINEVRIRVATVKPNRAHEVLAKWERDGRFADFLIATQNIDGLHQAAGSDRVTELHGSIWQVACPREGDYAEDEDFSEDFRNFLADADREATLRKWSEENHQQIWENREVPFHRIPPYSDPRRRPNVLLFDEPYGNRLLWVREFIDRKPDTVLVIGCSCTLYIVEHLLGLCLKTNPCCQIININPSQCDIAFVDVDLRLSATVAMTRIDGILT
jgi:NAD-dependent SIR2 family protein deacetylase